MVDWKDPETVWRASTGNYKYIVFDDFDTQGWFSKYYKMFLGAQQKVTVTDKYFKKFTFNHGKPCIFLSNDDLATFPLSHYDNDWIAANTVRQFVDSAFF